jgi:hypothetical protein
VQHQLLIELDLCANRTPTDVIPTFNYKLFDARRLMSDSHVDVVSSHVSSNSVHDKCSFQA